MANLFKFRVFFQDDNEGEIAPARADTNEAGNWQPYTWQANADDDDEREDDGRTPAHAICHQPGNYQAND